MKKIIGFIVSFFLFTIPVNAQETLDLTQPVMGPVPMEPIGIIIGDMPQFNLKPLDYSGRPHGMQATLSKDNRRTSEGRPSIQYDPIGFEQLQTESGWLYNRSHFLAYTLWDDDTTEEIENLFTGTEYLNQEMMTVYEDKVRMYLDQYPLVEYLVYPLYLDNELVPRAIFIEIATPQGNEAVALYNIEPGYTIDYQTGFAQPYDDGGAQDNPIIPQSDDQSYTEEKEPTIEKDKGFFEQLFDWLF